MRSWRSVIVIASAIGVCWSCGTPNKEEPSPPSERRLTEEIQDTSPATEDSGDSAGSTTQPELESAQVEWTEEEAQLVSFRQDVAPIFGAKCIDCHRPGNAVKVDLTAVFDPEVGLINRENSWPESSRPILVVPGDPDASALMLKYRRDRASPLYRGRSHAVGNPSAHER